VNAPRTHRVTVPERLQPPTCTCGWSAPLPFLCSWAEFDRLALAHMASLVACDAHGVQPRNGNGRCPGCASDLGRASWTARRARAAAAEEPTT
jgi:hypothetical protein